MVASQVARGFDLLKPTPTSFLTARAARRKWQMSKSGHQAAGRPCSWEADRPREERDMVVVVNVTQATNTDRLPETKHPVEFRCKISKSLICATTHRLYNTLILAVGVEVVIDTFTNTMKAKDSIVNLYQVELTFPVSICKITLHQ